MQWRLMRGNIIKNSFISFALEKSAGEEEGPGKRGARAAGVERESSVVRTGVIVLRKNTNKLAMGSFYKNKTLKEEDELSRFNLPQFQASPSPARIYVCFFDNIPTDFDFKIILNTALVALLT